MDNPLDSPAPTPPNTNNRALVQGVLLLLCWFLFFFNWGVFIFHQSQTLYFSGVLLIITAVLYFPLTLLLLYVFYQFLYVLLLGIEGLCWVFQLKDFKRWIQLLNAYITPLLFAFISQLFLAACILYSFFV